MGQFHSHHARWAAGLKLAHKIQEMTSSISPLDQAVAYESLLNTLVPLADDQAKNLGYLLPGVEKY